MADRVIKGAARLAVTAGLWLIFGSLPGFCLDPGDGEERRTITAELSAGPAVVSRAGFGAGLRYGGAVGLKSWNRLALEMLLERYAVPVAEGTADLGAGRLNVTPLLFTGYLFLSGKGPFFPYITIGAGFFFLHYVPEAETLPPQKDFVDRFALQLGGGTDLRISDTVALTVKVRYHLVKTWVEELPRTDRIGKVDPRDMDIIRLYALVFATGLKFRF